MSSRRDTDLEPLLEDLERTLGDLRAELESSPRGRSPRPPSASELLRFTESYTIPTVIAVLEATIRSLELLRQLLRLADPERTLGGERTSALPSRALASDVGRDAVDRVTRSLEELQRALAEADLPPDADARSIVEDARALSTEIEQRLSDAGRAPGERSAAGRSDARASRRGEGSSETAGRRAEAERGISIDVTDAGSEPADEDEQSEAATVDVEAELQSIKEELEARDEPAPGEHSADRDTSDADKADGDADKTDGDADKTDGHADES